MALSRGRKKAAELYDKWRFSAHLTPPLLAIMRGPIGHRRIAVRLCSTAGEACVTVSLSVSLADQGFATDAAI
jgi:hypothetical protein